MKIAFTAQGSKWTDMIDIRFGRAKGFFIVDTKTGNHSFIDNKSGIAAAHGAGTSAAQNIVDSGVKELITGRVGPKAASVLSAAGVKVLSGIGYATIKEAYERYQKGVLSEEKL